MSIVFGAIGNKEGLLISQHPQSYQSEIAVTTQTILTKIPRNNHTRTYTQQGYNYHYKYNMNYCYFCVADVDFPLRICFSFLDELEKEFHAAGCDKNKAKKIIEKKISYFNQKEHDKIYKVRGQIEEVKLTMLDNIDKVIERGERIENLVDKSETLRTDANNFTRAARKTKNRMCFMNFKLTIILAFVIIVILLAAIAAAIFFGCGGITFYRCKKL